MHPIGRRALLPIAVSLLSLAALWASTAAARNSVANAAPGLRTIRPPSCCCSSSLSRPASSSAQSR